MTSRDNFADQAMSELHRAEAHTILPVERLGDTLLVIPHGDLGGYSHRAFQTEFQTVQSLLDDSSIKHLIIDLGSSRYFGSEMIGALVSFRHQVADRGRAALTDVSPDMQAGLDIIRVDDLFERFGTRKEAIGALATLTVGQRVQRHRRAIKCAVVLLAVLGAAWGVAASGVGYRIFGSRTARVYEELAREWNRFDRQESRWTPEEARTYRAELLDRLASIERSLKQGQLITHKEDDWLEDSIKQFRAVVRIDSAEARSAFLNSMRAARSLIVSRTGIKVRQVAPSDGQSEPPNGPERGDIPEPGASDAEQDADADAADSEFVPSGTPQ